MILISIYRRLQLRSGVRLCLHPQDENMDALPFRQNTRLGRRPVREEHPAGKRKMPHSGTAGAGVQRLLLRQEEDPAQHQRGGQSGREPAHGYGAEGQTTDEEISGGVLQDVPVWYICPEREVLGYLEE